MQNRNQVYVYGTRRENDKKNTNWEVLIKKEKNKCG
jgi:hypothetical protein